KLGVRTWHLRRVGVGAAGLSVWVLREKIQTLGSGARWGRVVPGGGCGGGGGGRARRG
ncbi:hypothetical protein COCCADRAFT_91491, partial [Bipolaris zeicola 26-R-13]